MEHPILMAIRNAAFMPLGWFPATPADLFPQAAPGQPTRFVVMLGNAGPDMFRRFARERDPFRYKLDDWTREVLAPLAADLGATPVFPFDGPPWAPILTWARRGGGGHVSPLGLNIHPTYGLWHAYRAAFLFPVEFDIATPRNTHPCDSCADKPCLSACPVGAFTGKTYEMMACADHVKSEAGEACREGGCLARHACPVGRHFAYSPPQAQFHMRAFLKAREREA